MKYAITYIDKLLKLNGIENPIYIAKDNKITNRFNSNVMIFSNKKDAKKYINECIIHIDDIYKRYRSIKTKDLQSQFELLDEIKDTIFWFGFMASANNKKPVYKFNIINIENILI